MQISYAAKNSNFERSCDELGHFYASSKAPISLSCDHYSPESTPPFSSPHSPEFREQLFKLPFPSQRIWLGLDICPNIWGRGRHWEVGNMDSLGHLPSSHSAPLGMLPFQEPPRPSLFFASKWPCRKPWTRERKLKDWFSSNIGESINN